MQIMHCPIVWRRPSAVCRSGTRAYSILPSDAILSEFSPSYACPSWPPTGNSALPFVPSGGLRLSLHAVIDS